MDARPNPADFLHRPCIADTSLLSNFVHTGNAPLLHRLLAGRVYLSPTVLDPAEVLASYPYDREPRCELLKPLHLLAFSDYADYRAIAPPLHAFATGSHWQPVEPTEAELALAQALCDKQIWHPTFRTPPPMP